MSSRGKILIVWDDAETMPAVRDQLADDFETILVHDVATAYKQALSFQPDCIFSDYPPDKLIGNHLFKQIRKIQGLESIGILLLSDRREDRYAAPAEELDVDLCISKPYLIEEVTAALIGMAQVHRSCQKLLNTK